MAEITKGSITSSFPTSVPSFVAQSEAKDPVAEAPPRAEGRDANKWSAEVQAMAGTLGLGGRGEVYNPVNTPVVDVAGLRYVYQGVQVTYAGVLALALTVTSVNYVYLDAIDNTAKKAAAWPTTPHVRLASVDTTPDPPVVTDLRSHDLGVVGDGPGWIKRTASAISYLALDSAYLIAITSTAAIRTVDLPTAVGRTGKAYIIKDESGVAGTNNITVEPNGAETIDGDANLVLLDYGGVRIYSNGTNWFTW